jgi:MFS family permease
LLLGAFSWSLLVSAVCSPRVGRFIDRAGGRKVLAGGALITCAGLVALAGVQSVWQWYAAWTVIGVGMALGLYDATFATIGRLLGRESRGAIVGVTLIGGFASSLGFPAGTWLASEFGWRAAVLIYAAVQVSAILPLVLSVVPSSPGPPAVATPRAAEAAGRPPGQRDFVLLAIFFTLRAGIGALISVHALVLLKGLGLSTEAAVGVATLIGPAQVGSRIIDFRLARNLSPVTSAQIGAALLPIGIAALLGGAPAVVFALCYGMSNGIYTISRGTVPMHVFGPAGYATRLGRLALPSLFAQAIVPTLVAPLIDGLPASAMFAGIGTAAVLAFACLLPLRR